MIMVLIGQIVFLVEVDDISSCHRYMYIYVHCKHSLQCALQWSMVCHNCLHRMSSKIKYLLTCCVCVPVCGCAYVCVNKASRKKGLSICEMVECNYSFELVKIILYPEISSLIIWIQVYSFWIFSFQWSLVHFMSLFSIIHEQIVVEFLIFFLKSKANEQGAVLEFYRYN